ncbi:hypothetical protein F0L68_17010 [Solihabitans fulvus]|uniref:Serine protease n=1 Tax=Solihabitans fulvus TaxID=1892852 RepID=A0A5B2XEZ1_9PSEU|nr:hypothetical protein [Solihabitans fulvus]KAA2261480.1 hypothetical protein F0L68_17010 [Solihabitans fulvus]
MDGKYWSRILATMGALTVLAGMGATQTATAAQPETVSHGMAIRDGHATTAAPTRRTTNLSYHGGQVSVAPKVYIVYWGSQWGSAGGGGLPTQDPSGVASVQTSFFQHLYGAGDAWSNSTTQYCEGVATGTTQCGTSGTHVGHPSSSPLAGSWVDNTVTTPATPSSADITAEAQRAAAHFGDYSNGVQYIVDSPHGVIPQGFAAGAGGTYCAWHDSTVASGGTIAYTNMPYMPDAAASCGAGFVATGGSGVNSATEGVTIVGGHEYAETVTDQWPSTQLAWVDSRGAENGDKCAWISSGQGASAIVNLNGASFAVQSLWSNNFNNGAGGCVVSYTSATNQH